MSMKDFLASCVRDCFCFVLLGFAFPTLKESDAMFLSEKAPDWHDGEFCHRCRVQFGLVQRKVDHCLLQLIRQFVSVIKHLMIVIVLTAAKLPKLCSSCSCFPCTCYLSLRPEFSPCHKDIGSCLLC